MMKISYPVVVEKGERFFIAAIPDCAIDTQGETLIEAIEMARDAIALWCVCRQDAGRALPQPSPIESLDDSDAVAVLAVEADTDEYRQLFAGRRAPALA